MGGSGLDVYRDMYLGTAKNAELVVYVTNGDVGRIGRCCEFETSTHRDNLTVVFWDGRGAFNRGFEAGSGRYDPMALKHTCVMVQHVLCSQSSSRSVDTVRNDGRHGSREDTVDRQGGDPCLVYALRLPSWRPPSHS